MARQDALSMLNGSGGAAKLAEAYGSLIESIQKGALSTQLKSTRYVGDPTTGSVEVSRFINSSSKAYGTARTAGAGDLLNNVPVTINLNTNKEIVEEVENKDARLGTVENIISARTSNHNKTVIRELDTAFFTAITSIAGAEVTLTETDVEKQFEEFVQSIETLSNDYVDGVDRDMITVTLKPSIYGALRTKFDTIIGQDGEEFTAYHGVRVFSNTRQTADFVLVVDGAVAQPVVINEYTPSQIPLSDAAAIGLFFYYGTKVVAEDLVAWANVSES